MILRTKGKPINIEGHLVGRVSRDVETLNERTFLLLDKSVKDFPNTKFLGVLTTQQEYELKNGEM